MSKKVAVIMGSDSDFPTVSAAVKKLKSFGVPVEVHVMSAHRTPHDAAEFSEHAKENGFGVIIAAAGKAAHLACHWYSNQIFYIGRIGRFACNRTNAKRNSGSNRGH